MTKSELKPLYVEACTRARATPQKSEEAVWFSCIGYADIRDLKAAIDVHFDKSQWMPKEGELKPLIEKARHARQVQTFDKTQRLVRWQCPACKMQICGFPSRGDSLERRCYRKFWSQEQFEMLDCNALMTVIFDQYADADSGRLEKWNVRLSERIGQ
jgi:hypothetical protein